MMRARSSIRCSINGALVASMSSWLIPPRFFGRAAPRTRLPPEPLQAGPRRAAGPVSATSEHADFRAGGFGLGDLGLPGFRTGDVSRAGLDWRFDRLGDVVAHHADRIEAGVDLRLVADRLEFLLDAIEVGLALDLAHGLHELALELGRHSPHLADRLADGAHDARQILRRDHRQGDDADNDHLADVEIEHSSPDPATNERRGQRQAPVAGAPL